jgi:HPt (histidine-containing phosphotransfer) domain-containing protein
MISTKHGPHKAHGAPSDGLAAKPPRMAHPDGLAAKPPRMAHPDGLAAKPPRMTDPDGLASKPPRMTDPDGLASKPPRMTDPDGLDELRLAFHARLQSDRVHFVTLSAALARAEESPGWIFQDLQFRAHKIRGGAAIFEIAEVAAAACALEQAAISASMAHADNGDAGVWSALVALVQVMGTLDGNHDPAPFTISDRFRTVSSPVRPAR